LEVIRGAAELRTVAGEWRGSSLTVGLVPTMGALHAGHESLIRTARERDDRVVVSVFVNPLQFNRPEDLERYPRDEAADLALVGRLGADVVWAPPAHEVFPPGDELVTPDPGPVGLVLEGASRQGHFAGVLKVVYRLLEVVVPSRAYFGEKDAQQLFLVRRMVQELATRVEVVACPTIRDSDGLAMSSRNALMSSAEREQAGCLFLALSEAAALARSGERDAHRIVAAMAREIGATPLASLDYAAVVDDATFERLALVDRPARALVAARFPSARLIDNVTLPSLG
jgi:pantoate--beta-alanine ligase